MTDDKTASLIKVSAVITAAPRWVAALLAAEGLAIPAGWMLWWLPLSALFGAAMAIVEGVAFSYVFTAWRNSRDTHASKMLGWLAGASAALFVGVMMPYIAASVRGVSLGTILAYDPALWAWAGCVAASTIAIVSTVGYAQRVPRAPQAAPAKTDAPQIRVEQPQTPALPAVSSAHTCDTCGRTFERQQGLAAHMRSHNRNRVEVEA